MVNVKKRKGRVVIDSDSEDSASDDNLDQVKKKVDILYILFINAKNRVRVLKVLLGNISTDVHASSICAIFF